MKRLARIWFILAATALVLASEAAAHVFTLVEGTVELQEACGKTRFSDLKLLVRQDSPIDYSHNQSVSIGKDGRFSVYLVPSYNYNFQLLREEESDLLVTGMGRFESLYPYKKTVITAKCIRRPKES